MRKKKTNLALQITDKNKGILTQKEIEDFLSKMTWKDVELLSVEQPKEVKGYCEKNKHFVGQGTCIAKKFFNYGKTSYDCCSCFSDEILEQLNYIFQYNYDGLYIAEWRKIQERKPKAKEKPKDDTKPTVRRRARVGNKPESDSPRTNKPEESMKKPRGRPKKNVDETIQETTHTNEPTPIVKRGRGRPRKNPLPDPVLLTLETTEVGTPLKRGRGRPRKNENV